MRCHRTDLTLAAALLTATSLLGCARGVLSPPASAAPVGAAVPPSLVDDSALCRALADRFVGLPAMAAPRPPASTQASVAASAGRWWVRKCSTRDRGPELEVQLEGPGWYWIDEAGNGIRVTQQVPFELGLAITGRPHLAINGGIVSLWLEPSAKPQIHLRSPTALKARSESAWGDFLQAVPGVSPDRRAAERFNDALSGAFRESLQEGATVTYGIVSGQADAALGRLAPGQTPPHAFEDEPTWVINDRLLLAPSGSQVLGPIDPGPVRMNVIVESGPGLTYRAICEEALEESYSVIAGGALAQVPAKAWVTTGTMAGAGERTTTLRVDSCKFYLVASTLEGRATLAAIRVRA